MVILFVILVIIACVVLGFIVLIQNPKGGGLASNVGGFSNQFMGVKQTTDVLEKGTWVFATVVAVLCLSSMFFIGQRNSDDNLIKSIDTKQKSSAPAAPANTPGGAQQTPAPSPNQPK
jgi:preprotein translocase subunit SecG